MTKMPVLFIGHGSPMNAIEENRFVEGWRQMTAFRARQGLLGAVDRPLTPGV